MKHKNPFLPHVTTETDIKIQSLRNALVFSFYKSRVNTIKELILSKGKTFSNSLQHLPWYLWFNLHFGQNILLKKNPHIIKCR